MRSARETQERPGEPDPQKWSWVLDLAERVKLSYAATNTKLSYAEPNSISVGFFSLAPFLPSSSAIFFVFVCFRCHIPCSLAWSLLTWLSQIAFSWQPDRSLLLKSTNLQRLGQFLQSAIVCLFIVRRFGLWTDLPSDDAASLVLQGKKRSQEYV